MNILTIGGKPYAAINGKDFAVLRWFDIGRTGPIFCQVAGRTPLHKEDLPTDDWKLVTSGTGTTRVWTAWRSPWFDAKLDTRRRLAFLGASTSGSVFLAFRYLTTRYGLLADEITLTHRATVLLVSWEAPFLYAVNRVADRGLTKDDLIILDLDCLDDAASAAALLGLMPPQEAEPSPDTDD